MTYIGQHSPATQATQCRYCGASFFEVPTGYGVCDQCDLRNLFSDLYKDEVGIRPNLSQWTAREMRQWVGRRRAAQEA